MADMRCVCGHGLADHFRLACRGGLCWCRGIKDFRPAVTQTEHGVSRTTAEAIRNNPDARRQIEQLGKPRTSTCDWVQEDESSQGWVATCGFAWLFEDGGPGMNGMRFCPSCGKKLVELVMPYEPEEDDA